MRHTFKASFERQGDAQHLLDELIASGYTQASLALSGATHAGPYTRQRYAITLTVDSDQEARHALGLMEASYPARLQDDLLDQDGNLSGGAAGDASIPRPVRGRAGSTYPPGAEPGALQFRPLDDSRYFGTQDAAAPPAGTTFQETMGMAARWDEADEYLMQSRSKALWPDSAGGENDRERTAYLFGKALRADDRYRNRNWNEAEPGLRDAWAAVSSDAFTWEDAQSSMRRGWDEATPEIDDDNHYRAHWTSSYAHDTGGRGGDAATPSYMDDSEARRSERYRSNAPADPVLHDAGKPSAWRKLEDAIHHGWKRTDIHADDGSDGALGTWRKVKEAVRHGWHRVRS